MDALDLARLQFGVTTVYHFMFVPLTLGLAPLVAIMQTRWLQTGDDRWYRLTKFFGKLLLINFTIGVVTGIVQEFQFGMNWSEYSRFVGDVFGAPLAMEGLAAFFLESTFLGLWIFGWDRLPRKLHLACMWLFAAGTWMSAYFILAANSFMQHPVGVRYNAERGRAEMESIAAVLTNNTTLAAFPHVIGGALLTGATFVAGIAGWWMVKAGRAGDHESAKIYRQGLTLGLVVTLIAGIVVAASGDVQAKLMFKQQPLKMAAAEALCETEKGAGFSLFAIGDVENNCDVKQLTVPGVTSWLATGTFDAELKGVKELNEEAVNKYGKTFTDPSGKEHTIDYKPNLPITYWSFRLMIGFGVGSAALALAGLWLTRRGRTPTNQWFAKLALVAIPTPFLANAFGWVFTEMGRQPWVVAPNPTGVDGVRMLVLQGVSDHPTWVVATSLVVFTVVYGIAAIVWFGLMKDYVNHGLPTNEPEEVSQDDDKPLAFAY